MTSSIQVKDMSKEKTSGSKADADDKKNTSLRLDKKTLKALKIRAIEEDTSVQKIIETLIEAYLCKPTKKQG
jgi:predicted DNA binding CopG/RHH family protein